MVGTRHIEIDARHVSEVPRCSHVPEKGNGGRNHSQASDHPDYVQNEIGVFRRLSASAIAQVVRSVITPEAFSSRSMPSATSPGANSGE